MELKEIKVFERNDYSKTKALQDAIRPGYGYTYFLEYGGYLKIGSTTKPHDRLKNLIIHAESYGNCLLGRVAFLPCCANYQEIEKDLHNTFLDYRKIGTELFKISLGEAIKEIEKRDIGFLCENLRADIDKKELYWQKRIIEMEKRVEKLEAESVARNANPTNNSDCYSINEFAKALGVSRLTITRRIQSGVISAVKVGRYWKIPKNELKKIFED